MRYRMRGPSFVSRGRVLFGPLAVSLAVLLWGCALGEGRPGVAANPADAPPPTADTAFTPVSTDAYTARGAVTPTSTPLLLAVLHVQLPGATATEARRIWTFLRENVTDDETRLRLHRNGLRCGVGHVDDWDAIRAALDPIPGISYYQTNPVQVPAGFPLALELDNRPRDQTLFYVDEEATLRGATWPDSRNILRIAYAPDPRGPKRLRMQVVPEVHQEVSGWRWVRTEAGLWQVPNQSRQAFNTAAFSVSLAADEFLLIAAADEDAAGILLGNAFFSGERESGRYNSYVFLRPEVSDVGQRDQ